jgi:hypothetical protein
MERFASPTPTQARDLQKAIKRQNEARTRLASAATDDQVQHWAAEYIASTDDAYDVAKDVRRGVKDATS